MIVLDARYLAEPTSGVQRYLLNLLHGSATLGRPMRVLIPPDWSPPESLSRRASLDWVITEGRPRDPRDQLHWPGRLCRLNATLVHAPDGFAPLLTLEVPGVVTMHDLIPLHGHRSEVPTLKHRLLPVWKHWVTMQARHAQAIVTVSHYSGRDLVRTLRIPREKVFVIPNAVGVTQLPEAHGVTPWASQGESHHAYVLCVGRFEPYKNAAGLVRVFARWLQEHPERQESLMLVGPIDARFPEANREAERCGITQRVRFTGSVSDAELSQWYAGASALVMPSLDEGFGLPALEAMARGIPVLASDRASLPEVVGNAGLLVDVLDESAFIAALHRVLTDEPLRATLRQRGLERSTVFTAERNAALHWAVYERLLHQD